MAGGSSASSNGSGPTRPTKGTPDEEAPLLPKAYPSADAVPVPKLSSRPPVVDDIDADRPPPPAYLAARAAAVGLMHIGTSAALILFNKYLMAPDRFPFATFLTTMHMLAAFVFASALHRCVPELFPSADAVLGLNAGVVAARSKSAFGPVPRNLWAFAPIGACVAGSVVCANNAYRFASVSFLQMVKESVVLWVYLLTVLLGMEQLKMRNLAVLGFVTCSAALAVCGDLHFLWAGLLLQTSSSIMQATQAVMTSRLMTRLNGPKVDPLTMVLCTAPVVLCILLPCNYVFWDALIPRRLALYWKPLLLNTIAAFALQIVNAITIRELSATGLALAAVLKDLAIVGSATLVLNEVLTHTQVVGFAGAVAGISLYSTMKLQPAWFESPGPQPPAMRPA